MCLLNSYSPSICPFWTLETFQGYSYVGERYEQGYPFSLPSLWHYLTLPDTPDTTWQFSNVNLNDIGGSETALTFRLIRTSLLHRDNSEIEGPSEQVIYTDMAEGNLCQTRLTGHWMRELISNFGSNFIMQYNCIQILSFIIYRHNILYTTIYYQKCWRI